MSASLSQPELNTKNYSFPMYDPAGIEPPPLARSFVSARATLSLHHIGTAPHNTSNILPITVD